MAFYHFHILSKQMKSISSIKYLQPFRRKHDLPFNAELILSDDHQYQKEFRELPLYLSPF